jgi:hypothetical protein
MNLKLILESLSQEHIPGDEMTGAFLDDAVASFATNPAGATTSIRQLHESDPPGFFLAAVRLLTSTEEKTPGVQHVAGLMFSGNLLIDALLDSRILALPAATVLARNLTAAEPHLDGRLLRKMLANGGGDVRAVNGETALRVLAIVDAISNCSRLSTFLIQLMRHPNAGVRSKAALLMGRANLNLSRIKSFLTSDDALLRANVLESLWGRKDPRLLSILWEASQDKHERVAINALVGLCRFGERDAYDRLKQMAHSTEAAVRTGVAWAMGELGDGEFSGPLGELTRDGEQDVRRVAFKSLKRLSMAKASLD